MNITKRINKLFVRQMVEVQPKSNDRTIVIDWARRETMTIERNASRTLGF